MKAQNGPKYDPKRPCAPAFEWNRPISSWILGTPCAITLVKFGVDWPTLDPFCSHFQIFGGRDPKNIEFFANFEISPPIDSTASTSGFGEKLAPTFFVALVGGMTGGPSAKPSDAALQRYSVANFRFCPSSTLRPGPMPRSNFGIPFFSSAPRSSPDPRAFGLHDFRIRTVVLTVLQNSLFHLLYFEPSVRHFGQLDRRVKPRGFCKPLQTLSRHTKISFFPPFHDPLYLL